MTVDSGLAPREGTPYGDPKPERRIVDPDAFRRFRATADPACQVCCRPAGPETHDSLSRLSLTVHHLVPRSQGGDDLEENFAAVCGDGTRGCHGDLEHRRNGARERLRARLSEDQVGYLVHKKGLYWLDRHYPLPGREDDSLQGLA